jgi:hypothetical protein
MGAGKPRWYLPPITSIVVFGLIGFVVFTALLPGGRRIKKGPATRALHEITNIELGITKMLSDAGSMNLRDFFDDAAFSDAVARLGREQAIAPFEASVEIYTECTYVLLRKGRAAIDPEINEHAEVLRPELVKLLGRSYIPELAFDPWGELYRIFPGPWPDDMGPVIFRNYLPPYGEVPESNNLLMSGIDIETGESLTFGVPAPSNLEAYIWSFGANLVSGQPIYDPSHAYAPPAQQYYEAGQEPELCGGGDDINNWDRNQTFMRFYN